MRHPSTHVPPCLQDILPRPTPFDSYFWPPNPGPQLTLNAKPWPLAYPQRQTLALSWPWTPNPGPAPFDSYFWPPNPGTQLALDAKNSGPTPFDSCFWPQNPGTQLALAAKTWAYPFHSCFWPPCPVPQLALDAKPWPLAGPGRQTLALSWPQTPNTGPSPFNG